MKRASLKRTLLTDVAIAAAFVGFVLIVAPGLAIVGIVALLVLVVGAASFAIELTGSRRRPRTSLRDER